MGKLTNKLKNRTHQGSEEASYSIFDSKEGNKKVFPDFFSPKGFLLLIYAFILDLLSIVPAISVATAVVAVLTIGVYDWRHTGRLPVTRKLKIFIIKKYGARFILECIPIISAAPLWTVYVFRNSKGFQEVIEINETEEYVEADT